MALYFAETRPEVLAAVFFVIGAIAGGIANLWAIGLTPPRDLASLREKGAARSSPWYQLIPILGCVFSFGRKPLPRCTVGLRGLAVEVGTGLLFAAYVLAAARLECQQVAEVRPDDFWRSARIIDHLVLITLLVAATATDLRDYAIPDQITVPGMIFGLQRRRALGPIANGTRLGRLESGGPGNRGALHPRLARCPSPLARFGVERRRRPRRSGADVVRARLVRDDPPPRGARIWRRDTHGDDRHVYRLATDGLRLCAGPLMWPGLRSAVASDHAKGLSAVRSVSGRGDGRGPLFVEMALAVDAAGLRTPAEPGAFERGGRGQLGDSVADPPHVPIAIWSSDRGEGGFEE